MAAATDFQLTVEQNEAAEQRRAQQEALLHEREVYERRGMGDRVALVEAELERLAQGDSAGVEAVNLEVARRRAEARADQEALVAALVRERAGYLERGLLDRAALVDAELARVAAEAEQPRRRADRRKR